MRVIHPAIQQCPAANQWLLSEYDDPNITLSLNAFEAQIEIVTLYENIDIDAG